MIAPIGRYGLRGIALVPGRIQHHRSATLSRRCCGMFSARLARALRRDLPLLVVQLAGYGMPKTAPAESGWASLREAQRRLAAEDPHTALAVTIDIGDRYDIHPPNKQELGRRLARAARHVVYGEKLPPSGSGAASAQRDGDSVVVRFGDVSGELVAYGADGPVGFELCGAAPGTCRYASARDSRPRR